MAPSLSGKICLVTGAARGIGRGIALQLGAAGATVYITGRTDSSLQECAAEILARGGKPIPVRMDHSVDSDVEALFNKISGEQNGRLDVLVNNAYAGVNTIHKNSGRKFYDCDPVETWDDINGVGLRGHYLCTVYASRLMVPQKSGLIINISSPGGLRYLFNVAYGIGKAACDRMAADCAQELRGANVTMISLWPGPVKTEFVAENILKSGEQNSKSMSNVFAKSESVEYSGKAIVHLAADKNILSKSGKTLFTADLAEEYSYTDIDGAVPVNFRKLSAMLERRGYDWLASWVPGFVKVPNFLLHFGSYKFQ